VYWIDPVIQEIPDSVASVQTGSRKENLLIFVFDALSHSHVRSYGYGLIQLRQSILSHLTELSFAMPTRQPHTQSVHDKLVHRAFSRCPSGNPSEDRLRLITVPWPKSFVTMATVRPYFPGIRTCQAFSGWIKGLIMSGHPEAPWPPIS
jgi:hypothetical protein